MDKLSDLQEHEKIWHDIVAYYKNKYNDNKSHIKGIAHECRDMVALYRSEINAITQQAEENARMRHLRLHFIEDADIPLIGYGRKRVLAVYGIITAADISPNILHIDGFGNQLTNNLIAWRNSVLNTFRFDSRAALPPTHMRVIATKYKTKQRQLLQRADQLLAQMASLQPDMKAKIQDIIPSLRKAWEEYYDALANLDVMNE